MSDDGKRQAVDLAVKSIGNSQVDIQNILIFMDAALQLSGNHLKWKRVESIALWSMILTVRPGC